MSKQRFATIEAQRAYWNRKSKRRYARRLATEPDVLHAEMRANQANWLRKHPEYRPKPVPKATRTCTTCGTEFEAKGRPWKHCEDHRLATCNGCGVQFEPRHRSHPRRRTNKRYHSQACYFDYLARRPPKVRDPRMYKTCAIRVRNCLECGVLVTLHGGNRLCSDRCRSQRAKRWSRDYQRKTRATAIRYWRFADTPEAQQLATDYFLLRMELRHGPNQSRWRPDHDRSAS